MTLKNLRGGTLALLEDPSRVFLSSDTHFDHANIIRYEDRPFSDVDEMNCAIAANWNDRVRPDDLVIFLGDMSYGRGRRPASYWARRLNGRKAYIKGNHDRGIYQGIKAGKIVFVAYRAELAVDGSRFMLIHNPDEAPEAWVGWVIHGHKHGGDADLGGRFINVGVDVVGYRPISLARIMERAGISLPKADEIQRMPRRATPRKRRSKLRRQGDESMPILRGVRG